MRPRAWGLKNRRNFMKTEEIAIIRTTLIMQTGLALGLFASVYLIQLIATQT
jgi:hypothetical protein